MALNTNIITAIGNTPLVKINNILSNANLYAKADFLNPLGSVKDRAALFMVQHAIDNNLIIQGGTFVEPTSGNTGIALAYIARLKGFKVILTMPDTLSIERRKMLSQLGAQLVLTDGKLGMAGAVAKARGLLKTIPGSYMPNQFENPANVQAHIKTTAPEIWRDLDGQIDIFVAGVGTGGTISGCGKFFKDKNRDIQVIAIEPAASPVLSGGLPGPHKIQGIGAGFVPPILDRSVIDEILQITDEQAIQAAKLLHTKEGLYAGISAGAALCGALQIAARAQNAGKNIVFILPDNGDRYLSVL